MSPADQLLLTKWARNRDAEAFKALSKKYVGMVYATCTRILRDPVEAEDVAQECFETLARGDKGPTGHVGAWLHRVATNRCLDRIRTCERMMAFVSSTRERSG